MTACRSRSLQGPRRLWRIGGVFALSVAMLLPAACSSGKAHPPTTAAPSGSTAAPTARPNIIFILTDDLSWNLISARLTPHIAALARRGETFSHYFVADSLCCPSRTTIFTGLFPHDSKVVTNVPPDGGFQKFQKEGLDSKSFAVGLTDNGYTTSMLGKYLNGYGDPTMTSTTAPIPPGWSDWHVSNNSGYQEFNFFQNDNGRTNYYSGHGNYGVDVLNGDANSFIRHAGSKPFAIEIATYAPHEPYVPAPRNAGDFPGLKAPRTPAFNTSTVDPPTWLRGRPALTTAQTSALDKDYRRRAQSMESVDKMLGDLEATLVAKHLAGNTYIFFSSDNGLHLGEHRLGAGKQTAFETDIRVPLIVAGPGVPHNRVVPQVTQNVDLYSTFLDLAGDHQTGQSDGHSLVPLLHPTGTKPVWPTVALIEHHGDNFNASDPDLQPAGDNPPDYAAIRLSSKSLAGFKGSVEALYVEYADPQHDIEYYDLKSDPYEIRNKASTLTAAQRQELHKILVSLQGCHGAQDCWNAAQPQ